MQYQECRVGDQLVVINSDGVVAVVEVSRVDDRGAWFLVEAPRSVPVFRQELIDRMSGRRGVQ